jgi:hypothetical protein
MKTVGVVKTMSLLFVMLAITTGNAQQDRLEVPGDHFSLEGALELFKKSASPEQFEQLLNSPDSEVNNLDLNGDGEIDYIRVIDRNKGNIHTFTLQAVISQNEFQDVAVIALEKLADGKAVLQITGDADIYGIETIIEPTQEVRVNAGTTTTRTMVNVWTWPSVQYVYSPYYYAWESPWTWSYRPIWWNPWRPVAYYYYYPRWERYRPYYSVCLTNRIVYAHDIYRPYRSSSVIVYNRYNTHITNYRTSRSADVYRGREDDRRSYNGSQTREGDNRQRSVNTTNGNSRSDRNNTSSTWRNSASSLDRNPEGRSTDINTNGNAGTRGNSRSGNNSNTEVRQRSVDNTLKSDYERRYNSTNPNPVSRQRSESPKENWTNRDVSKSSSVWQQSNNGMERQPAQRSSGITNSNQGMPQRESRQPAYDTRGSQRPSTPEGQRKGSSENSSVGRPGGGDANKAPAPRRGRD